MMITTTALSLAILCASAPTTTPPPVRVVPESTSRPADELPRVLEDVRRLVEEPVEIELTKIGARDACRALSRTLKISIVPRFRHEDIPGLRPDQQIDVGIVRGTGREVLDHVCATLSSKTEVVTWQVRRGFIEIGPTSRLGVKGAWEVRAYPIERLLEESSSPYAAVSDLTPLRPELAQVAAKYHQPEPLPLIADDVIRAIVATIEPESWTPLPDAQSDGAREEEMDDELRGLLDPTFGDDDAKEVDDEVESDPARVLVHRRVGTFGQIAFDRGRLFVYAPDFIHRQIDGYRIVELMIKDVRVEQASAAPPTEKPH